MCDAGVTHVLKVSQFCDVIDFPQDFVSPHSGVFSHTFHKTQIYIDIYISAKVVGMDAGLLHMQTPRRAATGDGLSQVRIRHGRLFRVLPSHFRWDFFVLVPNANSREMRVLWIVTKVHLFERSTQSAVKILDTAPCNAL